MLKTKEIMGDVVKKVINVKFHKTVTGIKCKYPSTVKKDMILIFIIIMNLIIMNAKTCEKRN